MSVVVLDLYTKFVPLNERDNLNECPNLRMTLKKTQMNILKGII